MRFELLPHPAYLPDLAPSEFHLFQKLITCLTGQKFVCHKESIQAVNDCFEGLKENHFREEMENMEKRQVR